MTKEKIRKMSLKEASIRTKLDSGLKVIKNTAEIGKLHVKLASVKTVEYSIKGIIKTEELAKKTVNKAKSKFTDIEEWFAKNNYSKMELLTVIIWLIDIIAWGSLTIMFFSSSLIGSGIVALIITLWCYFMFATSLEIFNDNKIVVSVKTKKA